jgi:hypothetical protein
MSSLLLAAVWVSQLGIPSCHMILPLYGSQDDANNFFGAWKYLTISELIASTTMQKLNQRRRSPLGASNILTAYCVWSSRKCRCEFTYCPSIDVWTGWYHRRPFLLIRVHFTPSRGRCGRAVQWRKSEHITNSKAPKKSALNPMNHSRKSESEIAFSSSLELPFFSSSVLMHIEHTGIHSAGHWQKSHIAWSVNGARLLQEVLSGGSFAFLIPYPLVQWPIHRKGVSLTAWTANGPFEINWNISIPEFSGIHRNSESIGSTLQNWTKETVLWFGILDIHGQV